ncbi:hypothetical protein DPMN_053032 [Dreissena polymorpha]|uniref:Uncharacterized protein n=1 Tax=Dreissena polymorpha TaxID=45954 RepID=A0A9D4HNG8_DREPO|nr:hypothetical protein DPMN_053032 [Dreissena polymorpha]
MGTCVPEGCDITQRLPDCNSISKSSLIAARATSKTGVQLVKDGNTICSVFLLSCNAPNNQTVTNCTHT